MQAAQDELPHVHFRRIAGIGIAAADVPVVELAEVGQQSIGAGEYLVLLLVADVVADELPTVEVEPRHSLLIHLDAALAPAEPLEHLAPTT